MKHTNARRGTDGRFGGTDAPRAKRIEVWLQDQTIELLDTLCRQWGVGRGKVIGHLLTKGPVPPAAWLGVEPEPTTSGPPPEPAPEPEPTPEPTPTPSGPEPLDFGQFRSPHWEQLVADAKQLGIKGVTGNTVGAFKSRHKIPQGQPLSPEAQQLFRHEREKEARAAQGVARATDEQAARLAERATAGLLGLVALRVSSASACAITQPIAKAFLLAGLEPVGIKPRTRLVPSLWTDLAALVPEAGAVERELLAQALWLPENKVAARCLFWGTVIRLGAIEGQPPEGTAEFLEWSGYTVHQSHAERKSNQQRGDFTRVMRGNPRGSDDRRTLNLPPDAVLTRKGINDAFKALARQHHPDAGGEGAEFQRIADARDRLLLEATD